MPQYPHNGTPTSIAAARQIEPVAGTQGHDIMAFVRGCGRQGATAEEIEMATGISGNSVRPRLVQLRRDNLVVDSGKVRPTRSKRQAVVWVAVG
jgi:transcription initiation factor IIE alpha subunit